MRRRGARVVRIVVIEIKRGGGGSCTREMECGGARHFFGGSSSSLHVARSGERMRIYIDRDIIFDEPGLPFSNGGPWV